MSDGRKAMSAITTPFPETPATWSLPYRGKVAMAGLIIAESAIFTIFVVAYLFYVGKSLTGPTPQEVLETPIFFTHLSACRAVSPFTSREGRLNAVSKAHF